MPEEPNTASNLLDLSQTISSQYLKYLMRCSGMAKVFGPTEARSESQSNRLKSDSTVPTNRSRYPTDINPGSILVSHLILKKLFDNFSKFHILHTKFNSVILVIFGTWVFLILS